MLLRKAAISCLRQLTQREAKEVCEHAMTLASESRDTNIVEGKVDLESDKILVVDELLLVRKVLGRIYEACIISGTSIGMVN